MAYQLNENYFDSIDSCEKAYWLGFIWGDGYVAKRDRGYISYEFKLSLSEKDIEHLHLFNSHIESECPVRLYEIKSGFSTQYKEARLMISRKAFASRLYELGIKPNREEFNELLPHVPDEFRLDLMRGIIDSDGGFTQREVEHNGSRGKGIVRTEYSVHLIANPEVLDFFNTLLIKYELTETIYKQTKRHEGADGNVLMMRITGNNMTEKIADLLYGGKEGLSLTRKYKKYEEIKSYMDLFRREKCKV